MEKLIFDSGVKEYAINDNGVLRFNPSDPNVYARFMAAMTKIQTVEEDLVSRAGQMENDEQNGAEALRLMADADRQIKGILGEVFGGDNDFDSLMGGVNLLAVAGNGERVITNFLAALQPIMVSGAERCVQQHSEAAVEQAKLNRAQRRAAK